MSRWKVLHDSLAGSSHDRANLPCQDYCCAREITILDDAVMAVVCADGAGSASHSDLGARLTCELLLEFIAEHLDNSKSLSTITAATVVEWCERVQSALQSTAAELNTTLRQLACTLLTAIVGSDVAVFFQVGDGVIVRLDNDIYRHVFWPDRGEYANTTSFVTQPDVASSLVFESIDASIQEFAVLTDGLQMLALEYGSERVHQPFFADIFSTLREYEDTQSLAVPLKRFLNSPEVNARTDDDKTLVLVTRVTSSVKSQ